MRSALAQHELDFGPNMTPMVDIVMVILIFFMGATTFAGAEWFLHMAVPVASAGEGAGDPFELPPARFEIRLRPGADGRVLWSGIGEGEQKMEMLEPMLTALVERVGVETVEVIIQPEGGTVYEDVVRAADACAAAGVRVVGLGL